MADMANIPNNDVKARIEFGKYKATMSDFYDSLQCDKSNKQLFLKTLNKYMETLDKHIESLKEASSTLEIIRDATHENDNVRLEFDEDNNWLSVVGDKNVIETYVYNGLANFYVDFYEDDAFHSKYYDDSAESTESSTEYNEYGVSDNDSNNSNNSDNSDDSDADADNNSDYC